MDIYEFYNLVEKHDYTYNYSDDNGYYIKGCREIEKIHDLINTDDTDEFKKIYRAFVRYWEHLSDKPTID